ncbi:MAG: hypothetical protein KDK64_00310 [Chlamydiia bacterium]|nr:hypothetical protein [Chlamydiia bacterium]
MMKSRSAKYFFCIFLCFSLCTLYAAPEPTPRKHPDLSPEKSLIPDESIGPGYTINFDNVPILEVIKFISKIGKVNFVYEEEELRFNVSIVSEEPTPLVHVMAAFIQVLRINGFDLIEQGNNLVITKGSGIKQIATVVSAEVPLSGDYVPPLMTRVFYVKNANPATLAGIIRPLLSDTAIIEVSEATRNIIVTDITQNIEEIHKLFYTLDVPKTPLSIDSYVCRTNTPDELIALANQILIPVSEGNPLIFVPQNSTRSIFIVSTPFLIEQAIMILEDLDNPPSLSRGIQGPLSQDNILLYHIRNKPADVLMQALQTVQHNLEQVGPSSQNLVTALKTVKFIKQSHSLFFVGDAQSLKEIQVILEGLDLPYSEQELEHLRKTIWIYKIQYDDEESIARSLQKLVQNLKTHDHPDQDFIDSIESMKYIKENDSLMFTGDERSINLLKKYLPLFDVPQHMKTKLPLSNQFFIYRPIHETAEALLSQVKGTAKNLKNANFADAAFLKALNSATLSENDTSVTFTGDQQSLDRIKVLVAGMDQPSGEAPTETYTYKIQFVTPEYLEKGLQGIAKPLPADSPLAQTIQTMHYAKETNTMVFRGSAATLAELKNILPTIDQASEKPAYFVYKLQHAQGDQIIKDLKETAKSIKSDTTQDKQLVQTINNINWVESTNSLVISGPAFAVDRIRTMIAQDDVPRDQASSFFVYKPIGLTPEEFRERVLATSKEMSASGLQNSDLLEAMRSVKIVSNGSAVMFTGTPQAINQIKGMIQEFDAERAAQPKSSSFFIYKPTAISADKLREDIIKSARQLEKSGLQDPELISAMESARVTSGGTQVSFTGTPEAISKIKIMVTQYDNQQESTKASHYFIFKPRFQTPEEIIKQSKHAADQMEDNGLVDQNLISALNSATVVSQGTGVLYTGTPEAIKQIEGLAPTFDNPTSSSPDTNDFIIYEPVHVSADTLRQHARRVASDMEDAGFTDKNLVNTLQNTRLVSNGKKVLFTGTSAAIQKVQAMLPSLDTPTDDQPKQPGKTTFTIYKIKYLSGPTLMGYLRNMSSDLQRAGSTQDDLITTLNNMRYVQDTNSIIFTGTPHAVQEAVSLAQKFDIPSLAQEAPTRAPTGYLIYKPKYVPGEELIRILHDFEGNLRTSGVNDRELSDVINNLKWMERTSSILVSGDDAETKKVYGLLERFDVPGPGVPEGEPGMETVSDTSFLIYKLQYHSGDEIQTAIRQIGTDLERSKSNNDLAQAIQTLQWIEVTNSLVATGQADALGKLKELIKSIDVPLKQVFVEILVIETENADQLEFGLHWGSQGVYRNKFSYGTYNQPVNTTNNQDPLASFNSNIQQLNSTTTPTGLMIPIATGGDLGVIGDIILHKGQTHFGLGSLINALKNDGDSTIVMNQKIITQDNKMSTIFTGQNIPYTGSVVTNTGSNTVTTANLEYRDVGISLSITPVVGNNDIITLMIEEDISEDITTDQGSSTTPDQVSGITTSKNTTKVVVSVPDKSFLVLSGSIQDTKTRNKTGIPCLGGLPIIGAAFSDSSYDRSVSNIVFFVRPQIIKSFDVYAEITERQEGIFRGYSGDPEDFDAGLELVKTPDDSY